MCTIELSREEWLNELGDPLTFEDWCGEQGRDADVPGVIGSKTGRYRLEPVSGSWPVLNEDLKGIHRPRNNPMVVPIYPNTCDGADEECKNTFCRKRCFYRQQRWERLQNGEFHRKSLTNIQCESDAQCGAEEAVVNKEYGPFACVWGMCQNEAGVKPLYLHKEPISFDYAVELVGYFTFVDNGCRYFAVHNFEFKEGRADCNMWVDTPVNFVEDDNQPEMTINELDFESEVFQNSEFLETTVSPDRQTAQTTTTETTTTTTTA